MLRDHIGAHGYEECQEDISAVSGMAEDIRDALLDYQVGNDKTQVVIIPLTLGYLDRQPNSGQSMTRTAG